MNITLCGSLVFNEKYLALRRDLEHMGHTVRIPHSADTGHSKEWWNELLARDPEAFIAAREELMAEHFRWVDECDVVLVCNWDRRGMPGYIGVNTLMEMAVGFHLKKPLYLLHPIPQGESYEEIIAMRPVVLNGDIGVWDSNLP